MWYYTHTIMGHCIFHWNSKFLSYFLRGKIQIYKHDSNYFKRADQHLKNTPFTVFSRFFVKSIIVMGLLFLYRYFISTSVIVCIIGLSFSVISLPHIGLIQRPCSFYIRQLQRLFAFHIVVNIQRIRIATLAGKAHLQRLLGTV